MKSKMFYVKVFVALFVVCCIIWWGLVEAGPCHDFAVAIGVCGFVIACNIGAEGIKSDNEYARKHGHDEGFDN